MRFVWSFGLGVVILAGAGVLYAHRNAPPSCRDRDVIAKVSDILHGRFHLESIFLNDVQTVSNGYFGDSYACLAEVAEIKGNVNASSMDWRQVSYRIVSRGAGADVTVDLGEAVSLAPPQKSFWARLFARFGG